MRIVSLLPSATEMICALGLRDQLVGVTHECDFPESVVTLPRVTKTVIPHDAGSAQIDALVRDRARNRTALYQLDVPALKALRPDLVVTQALCDVFECMLKVAHAAGATDQGDTAIAELIRRTERIAERCRRLPAHPSVIFLEWIDPLFCGGHWNPELVQLAGGRELIGKAGARSRRIELEKLRHADPDVVFIACCGFSAERASTDLPLLKRKPGWDELKAVKRNRVIVADGSAYFNRPGPRLVDSLEKLAGLLHGTGCESETHERMVGRTLG